MEVLLRDCPFNVDLTSLGSNSPCLAEVSPYRNLTEVAQFLHLASSASIYTWLDEVRELQPATDYCYTNQDEEISDKWYPKPRLERKSVPKTLVCHDYKGNYLEDRFVNGSNKHDAYNFFNWPCIDIFVYFSHHFITVPPPTWTNAAHEHGVPILGTVITESLDGEAIWSEILQSDDKTRWFADVLSAIAATHKFDGYLLNIENRLDKTVMPRFLSFVETLKKRLKSRLGSRNYLIWYDSVTINGDLTWQNELNNLNKPFFDITDGIFLNYTWTEQHLARSKELAAERVHDVYVGVDVFGRNFFGGGGYNSHSAMTKIRERNLSAAIFAFGWTEEAAPGHYLINDRIFWSRLSQFFYTHGTKKFPFKTNFCRGYGLKFYRNGVTYMNETWFDLSRQDFQYLYLKHEHEFNERVFNDIVTLHANFKSEEKELKESGKTQEIPWKLLEFKRNLQTHYDRLADSVIQYADDIAFNGGGCLRIRPLMQVKTKHLVLVVCDIDLKRSCTVTVVTKPLQENQAVLPDDYPFVYVVIETDEDVLVKKELKHSISAWSYENGITVPQIGTGWTNRKYKLVERGRIIELGIFVSPSHKEMLLGEISIDDS